MGKIILSEVIQAQKDKHHMFSLICRSLASEFLIPVFKVEQRAMVMGEWSGLKVMLVKHI